MGIIQQLCPATIVLNRGVIEFAGETSRAIESYIASYNRTSTNMQFFTPSSGRDAASPVEFSDACVIESTTGKSVDSLVSGRSYAIQLQITNNTNTVYENVIISYAIGDLSGQYYLLFRSTFEGVYFSIQPGVSIVSSSIDRLPLVPGVYSASLFCSYRDSETLDMIEDAFKISIERSEFFPTGSPGLGTHCKILTPTKWSIKHSPHALHQTLK